MSDESKKADIRAEVRIGDGMLFVNLWDYIEHILTDVDLKADEMFEDNKPEEGTPEYAKFQLMQILAYQMLGTIIVDRSVPTGAYQNSKVAQLRSAFLAHEDLPSIFWQTCKYWLEQIAEAERARRRAETESARATQAYYSLREWVKNHFGDDQLRYMPVLDFVPHERTYSITDEQAAAAMTGESRLPKRKARVISVPRSWQWDDHQTAEKCNEIIADMQEKGYVLFHIIKRYGDDSLMVFVKEEEPCTSSSENAPRA